MRLWKGVFGFYVLFFCISIFQMLVSFQALDIVSNLVLGLTCMGLYGFAYQVGYGYRWFAVAIFFVNLFSVGGAFAYTLFALLDRFSLVQILLSLIVCAFLYVSIYPLFMYAFKSPHLWANEQDC